jgi:exodeoxyribonuclease VII small subunit
MTNPNELLTYDQAFAELESVLAQLEDGDLPLEQTLALYEQGVALANLCQQKLTAAELRVRQWQGAGTQGDPGAAGPGSGAGETRPFEGWQEQ